MFFCEKVRTTSSVQHASKIYLPPIGLRLVQKYVGVDFKRPSPGKDDRGLNALSNALNLKRPAFPDPESLKLKSILKHVDGLTTERDNGQDPHTISKAGPADIRKHSIHKVDDYVINENVISSSVPLYHNSVVMEAGKYDSQVKSNKQNMNANALFQLTNEEPIEEPMSTRSKTPISDQQTRNEINLNMTFSHNPHEPTANTRESEQLSCDEVFGETNALNKDGIVNDSPETQGKVVIDTSYNLVERRSSRSTFRT
ncbi:hypothetical protein DPMN_045748 [Dreissena polymorpha]|uniref:Uncharacterized protein n=1 Tax=Dreissena polymorpha TaxID=45954 RepID=A0A9D4D738_DREPO|nr:hypothetical protein DPMN_045748 [Dreissena polymorpha]